MMQLATALPLATVPASAETLPTGMTRLPPIATSAVAPSRQALIIAPALAQGASPRSAVAQVDAERYRDLLRQLGFEVTLVVPETRLTLDLGVRAFADPLGPDTEAVVLILGAIFPKGDDLYVMVADGPAPSLETYETEGVSVADIMKRVAARAPKETVVLVDECHAAAGQACRIGAGTMPDGASGIVGMRAPPAAAGTPLAGLASLRGELTPLMTREGLAYLDLYSALKEKLAGTNMTVASTPSLTRGFAFLPTGFFAGLPTPCNKVDVEASAERLKDGPSLAPLLDACTKAAGTYDITPYFKDRLATVREQAAFQRAAAADCTQPRELDAYLEAYPDGRYHQAARARKAECDEAERVAATPPPAPEPPPAPAPTQPPEPTQPHEPTPTRGTCTVGGLDPAGNNWLALRERPSYQAPWSSTHMGPGTVVTVLGQDGDWMRVALRNGEIGWANARYLSCGREPERPSPPASATCRVDGLDPNGDNWLALRMHPDFKPPWSDTHMGPGTPLTVFGRQGPWLHVRLRSGETGWAFSQYVRCPD